MKPEDEQLQEHIKMLEELKDRMLKSGLMVAHGHSEKRNIVAANFTLDGMMCMNAIAMLNGKLAPLTNKEIIILWRFLAEFGKQWANRNTPPDT